MQSRLTPGFFNGITHFGFDSYLSWKNIKINALQKCEKLTAPQKFAQSFLKP
jgi:hypothetical protein